MFCIKIKQSFKTTAAQKTVGHAMRCTVIFLWMLRTSAWGLMNYSGRGCRSFSLTVMCISTLTVMKPVFNWKPLFYLSLSCFHFQLRSSLLTIISEVFRKINSDDLRSVLSEWIKDLYDCCFIAMCCWNYWMFWYIISA
jgi:hypothetical protein